MKKLLSVVAMLGCIGLQQASADDEIIQLSQGYTPTEVRYWFDFSKQVYTAPYSAGKGLSLSLPELGVGSHTIFWQVVDDKGGVTPISLSHFYLGSEAVVDLGTKKDAETISYWFDFNTGTLQNDKSAEKGNMSIGGNSAGSHNVMAQLKTAEGDVTQVALGHYYTAEDSLPAVTEYKGVAKNVHLWLDDTGDVAAVNAYAGGKGVFDIAAAKEGKHVVNSIVEYEDGALSQTMSGNVFRSLFDLYVIEPLSNDSIDTTPRQDDKFDVSLDYMVDNTIYYSSEKYVGKLDINKEMQMNRFRIRQQLGDSYGDRSKYKFDYSGNWYFSQPSLITDAFARASQVDANISMYAGCWHFISLPFNVKRNEIVDLSDGADVIREFSGSARANLLDINDQWSDVEGDKILEAGKGYIMQCASKESSNEYVFHAINDGAKNNIFTRDNVTLKLETYPSEFAFNRSWNLVGNPYPSFFDTEYIEGKSNVVVVWNGNQYDAKSIVDDKLVLAPFEAFFIQRPADESDVVFNKIGRQHTIEKIERSDSAFAKRRAQAVNANRQLFNIKLSDGRMSDNYRIVLNENALAAYEVGRDAAKMYMAEPTTPLIYGEENGVEYAINERPLSSDDSFISIFAPKAGEYTMSVDTKETINLLDTYTGELVELNADEQYTFLAEAGWQKCRFALAMGTADAIAKLETAQKANVAEVFTVDGRKIASGARISDLRLTNGMYVVKCGKETHKIIIK